MTRLFRPTTAVSLSALLALAVGGFGRSHAGITDDGLLFSAAARVDLGPDRGQNFGSLFEFRDRQGRIVAGAGFPAVYNTRFRMDRHALQGFVRPVGPDPRPTLTRLPRPDNHCGLYMFDFDGRLYATNDSLGPRFHEWDPGANGWRAPRRPAEAGRSANDGVEHLGGGVLRFLDGKVEYAGRIVLPAPAEGRYNYFYYAQGRLYFYHSHHAGTGGYTRVYAVPWSPEQPGPADLSRADVLPTAQVGEVTWAWGQHGRQVLTVSNYGGVYVHDEGGWRVLRPTSPGVSYQVYSMVTYRDRLLLGQYPTGEVFEYDGERLHRKEGFPPRLPGVSPSARECQTLALYRGELYAGVWPWAEVWRHEEHAGRWLSLGRLFTHPAVTDRAVHPYEAESLRHALVVNHWGQRVTSAAVVGGSLMLSTSAKGNHPWEARYLEFLTEKQRQEYGTVHQLTLPGNVSAPIRWQPRPIRLELRVYRDRLELLQEGERLAVEPFDPTYVQAFVGGEVRWGEGVYGPLQGKILERRSASRP